MKNKLYVIRKYIMAKSIEEVIKKEKKIKPDEIWIDVELKKENKDTKTNLVDAIGFLTDDEDDESGA